MSTSTHQRPTRARQPPRVVGEPQPLRIDPVPPQRERLLVRIGEAAAILACERKRIYKLFADGEIETIGTGASRRVVVESLRAYVEREQQIERGRRRRA